MPGGSEDDQRGGLGRDTSAPFAEELGIKTIAKRLGIARNTGRAAVRSSEPPSYEREGPRSRVDAVEDEIRALLGEFSEMSATVIAERIGWPYGITVLRDRVRELRPLFVAPDPAQRVFWLFGFQGWIVLRRVQLGVPA